MEAERRRTREEGQKDHTPGQGQMGQGLKRERMG